MKKITATLMASLIFILLTACEKEKDPQWTYQISRVKHSFLATMQTSVNNHSSSVDNLNLRVVEMITIPSESRYNLAKEAWKESHHHFLDLKLYYLMSGAFSHDINYNPLRIEGSNVIESYIDYTQADPGSGLISDQTNYPIISPASVESWHDVNNNKLTLGYHVLEFMLWGEDLSSTGAGNRSNSDYIVVPGNEVIDRRRMFTRIVATHLYEDFSNVSFTEKFRDRVLLSENANFMEFVLKGLISYTDELAKNVLLIPYNSQNQEDELSRFSDNTLDDIGSMIGAMEDLLTGEGLFEVDNDYFLANLFEESDPDNYTAAMSALKNAKSKISSIQVPFDVAITNSVEREKIINAYNSLNDFSARLRSFGTIWNLDL